MSSIEREAEQQPGIVGTVVRNVDGVDLLIPEAELRRIAPIMDGTCAHCGTEFEPRRGSGGRPQKYCSPECRAGAPRQRGQRGGPSVGVAAPTVGLVIPEAKNASEGATVDDDK